MSTEDHACFYGCLTCLERKERQAGMEEPAWKAELEDALRRADYDFPIEQIHDLAEQIAPHIQAAEERGRREALEWEAYEFTEDAKRALATEPCRSEILSGVAYILRTHAESP